MARPRKTGLDYFPFDCDFFEDEKIVAIAGEFGIKGEIAAIKLLCAVYRNGYFIEWNEMLRLKLLRQMPGVSAELFDQILHRLIRWGFFNASLFDSVKVLSSVGIQRRYFEAAKFRLKDVKAEYLLLNEYKDYSSKNGEKGVSQTKTPVSQTKTPVSQTKTPQIKRNKIKEKKSPYGDKKKNGVIPGFEESLKKSRGYRKRAFDVPTLEETLEYFQKHTCSPEDWDLQARLFYSHYDSLGWKNAYGTNVERWDSRANNWILRIEKERRKQKTHSDEQNRIFDGRTPSGGVPIKGKVVPAYGLKRPDKG